MIWIFDLAPAIEAKDDGDAVQVKKPKKFKKEEEEDKEEDEDEEQEVEDSGKTFHSWFT